MRKIALTGLAALAMMLGGVAHASAAVNPAPAWPAAVSATAAVAAPVAGPTANPSVSGSRVSCASAKSCLVVSQNTDSAGNSVPVLSAWNGTSWKMLAVTLQRGASGALNGVSCKQASCLAVGNYATKTGDYLFALKWNGKTLTRVAGPPMPAGAPDTSLGDVSCVTASSCVVIGSAATAAGTTRAVVDTWNGVKWTMHTAALPASVLGAEFAGLSCVSAGHCVAGGLGVWGSIASGSFTPGPLLASWNGRTVTTVKASAPKGAGFQMITDVSCVSATSCVATGFGGSTTGTTTYGFTDVLAGQAWKMKAVAWPRGSASTGLLGVSCTSARSCVAVGADGIAASATGDTGNAAALSYNGTTWTVQKTVPGPGRGNASMFGGVSCVTATYCVASGLTGKAAGNASVPLTGVWNGRTWKLFRLP